MAARPFYTHSPTFLDALASLRAMLEINWLINWFTSGIDEILDLEKISRGNGPFFSISSWRIEFSFLEMLSNVKILKKKFSFSRNSRFWKKFSSLLERMRFCKQILFLFSILHSMYFPILVRNHILLFGLILTISALWC